MPLGTDMSSGSAACPKTKGTVLCTRIRHSTCWRRTASSSRRQGRTHRCRPFWLRWSAKRGQAGDTRLLTVHHLAKGGGGKGEAAFFFPLVAVLPPPSRGLEEGVRLTPAPMRRQSPLCDGHGATWRGRSYAVRYRHPSALAPGGWEDAVVTADRVAIVTVAAWCSDRQYYHARGNIVGH